MRKVFVLFCVSGIVAGSAAADPANLEGGAFIAHFPTGMEFSSDPPAGGWCQEYWDHFRIEDCEDQVNRIDTTDQVIWFVLAAWAEEKEWCGTEFGLGEFDPSIFSITDRGPCWPEDGLEIPTASWPGPGEGTAIVATGTPWEGNFVPVYWFAGYAYEEGLIPLAADPATDFAGTSNCANPPQAWAADSLGGMGLFADGTYVCPPVGQGGGLAPGQTGQQGGEDPPLEEIAACCFGTSCSLLTEQQCYDLVGLFLPQYPICDPNPCTSQQTIVVDPWQGQGTYENIRDAVERSRKGDTIELVDGEYTGTDNRDIWINDHHLFFRSRSGDPDACRINCEGMSTALTFDGSLVAGSHVFGIAFRNGYNDGGLP